MKLKNKKILITGGAGFIGTNLIIELLKHTKKIINLDIKKPKYHKHSKFWKNFDINNFEDLKKLINKYSPDFIVNLAAKTDLDGNTLDYYKTNTTGAENIIKISMKLKKLKRVIFFSTRLVCQIGYTPKNDNDYCPTTIYGKSKVIGEKILKRKKYKKFKKWVNIRPTSLWGPWFDVPYRNFFDAIKNRLYMHPSNKKIYKSFGYVENSVFQIVKLMLTHSKSVEKKTFYLCDFDSIELMSFSNKISHYFKVMKPLKVPLLLLKLISIFGDFLKLFNIKFPLTSFRLKNLLTNMEHDTVNLKKITGNLPFSLNKGIYKTIKWMEK